jgi:hypothetical protein
MMFLCVVLRCYINSIPDQLEKQYLSGIRGRELSDCLNRVGSDLGITPGAIMEYDYIPMGSILPLNNPPANTFNNATMVAMIQPPERFQIHYGKFLN